MFRFSILGILTAALLISTAHADRRKYVWTYQFATIAPEASELEFYQTTKIRESGPDSWEYRIEIEHGLTPNWDLSIYQIFSQDEGAALRWDAFQIRTRYKLAAYGKFLLDPLLYLEYNRKTDLSEQNKLETKLILARDVGRWNIALNPVWEFFWAPGEPVHEIGWDAGLGYELSYRFSASIESVYRNEIVPDAANESNSYLGPTISYASGSIYYTVGIAWGLNDRADHSRVRFLLGVDL